MKYVRLGCGCVITREDNHNYSFKFCIVHEKLGLFDESLHDAKALGDRNFSKAYRMWNGADP